MIIPTYLSSVERLLFADETVQFTARQRRVGPGGSILTPSVVVATNERLLLIKDVLMLHIRQDIEAVPYSNVTYTKVAHGIMSSELILGVVGYYGEDVGKRNPNTVEIMGLRYNDAVELAQLIDNAVIKIKGSTPEETVTEFHQDASKIVNKEKWRIVCKKCNAKNDFGAHYCANCGAQL